MTEKSIMKYREFEGPKLTHAYLELENVMEVETFLSPYMHSGTSGTIYSNVYHKNCTTIIVTQNDIETIASWKNKTGDLKCGWQNRIFKIAGQKSNVEEIVEEIKEKGIKLEEIKS